MSEYWVSKKRYFCKYCDTYIADDAPSRQHHENGLRHKGNVERFVRGLYKAGEKQKKDAEEEKREMMRIERVCIHHLLPHPIPLLRLPSNCPTEKAASAAFAEDVGAGRAQYPSSSTAAPRASTSSSQKPKRSDGISNYSTPESLGYTDPDIERALAEAERRRTQGFAGEWQVVEPNPAEPPSGTSEETKPGDTTRHTDDNQEAPNKRPPSDPADEDEGRWKLRKKMATVGLGTVYDPGIVSFKPKAKVEINEGPVDTVTPSTFLAPTPSDKGASALPKWAPVKWKKGGEQVHETNDVASTEPATDNSHTESAPTASAGPSRGEEENALASATDAPVKVEPDEEPRPVEAPPEENPAGSSVFRKRKTPARGSSNSLGRRF